jgi:hypothetical protein
MIIDELFEAPQQCPECGGISFSDLILAEKKDACYHKVKASAKVWPSAYASGRLVQCRKKGAANYGNKSEGVAEGSRESVSFREMVNVVDEHFPKYYAELSGSDISDKQFEQKIINAYKKIMQKQGMAETRRGQIPMTLQPGETDNIEPENISGFRTLPAYKQGQAAQQKAGKQLIQKSPHTYQSDQDFAYRQGAFDAQQTAMFANFGKSKPLTIEGGEQQKGADYRDPKEVDYDDEYDAMVARVKKLAGLGPMRTVYDPNKRQYRNMPTAQQPKK